MVGAIIFFNSYCAWGYNSDLATELILKHMPFESWY